MFLKWPGSKRRLLNRLATLLPCQITGYFEPFLGSGAMYFYLAKHGLIKEAVLADANWQLIETFKAVQTNVAKLKQDVKALADDYDKSADHKAFYYEHRVKFNEEFDPALLIFLNKAGFNGLYRVNSKGLFNVPAGNRKKHSAIYQPELLDEAHKLLQCSNIICSESFAYIAGLSAKDFVFVDPPYIGAFAQYTVNGFSLENQLALADCCLATKAKVLATNAYLPITMGELYKGFSQYPLPIKHIIGQHRLDTCEIAMRNY